ncbi:MAG: hypothetical protein WC756_15510 [Taibaiella sp.]|jgi:hypothetical protein
MLFAALIALQYLRLPKIRKKYSGFYRKLDEKRLEIIKAIFKQEYPESRTFIGSIKISRNEGGEPMEQAY